MEAVTEIASAEEGAVVPSPVQFVEVFLRSDGVQSENGMFEQDFFESLHGLFGRTDFVQIRS